MVRRVSDFSDLRSINISNNDGVRVDDEVRDDKYGDVLSGILQDSINDVDNGIQIKIGVVILVIGNRRDEEDINDVIEGISCVEDIKGCVDGGVEVVMLVGYRLKIVYYRVIEIRIE